MAFANHLIRIGIPDKSVRQTRQTDKQNYSGAFVDDMKNFSDVARRDNMHFSSEGTLRLANLASANHHMFCTYGIRQSSY